MVRLSGKEKTPKTKEGLQPPNRTMTSKPLSQALAATAEDIEGKRERDREYIYIYRERERRNM